MGRIQKTGNRMRKTDSQMREMQASARRKTVEFRAVGMDVLIGFVGHVLVSILSVVWLCYVSLMGIILH